MFDVLALGELLIDFTPAGVNEHGSPLYASNPGGAPANVLVAISRLGGSVAFIGKIGDDQFGDLLREALDKEGVCTDGLLVSRDVSTTLAFVTLNEEGDRSFVFYRKPGADVMLEKSDVVQNERLISNCRVFHFGSVSLTDDPSRTATLYAAEMAKKRGAVVSYDPNYRPHLWTNRDLAVRWMLEGLKLADIVKVSYEEMELLTGERTLTEGSGRIAEYGASAVLVTLGAEGAYYRLGNLTGKVGTYDAQVADTTGAGDAFLGAFLYCIRGKALGDIAAMSREEADSIVLFANAAGALATTRKGAIPSLPTLREIADYQQKGLMTSG